MNIEKLIEAAKLYGIDAAAWQWRTYMQYGKR